MKTPRSWVRSAGVDWITCTNDEGAGKELWRFGLALLRAQETRGYDVREGHLEGYRTRSTEGVMIGDRGTDYLLRLSGPTAHEQWREALPLARNVSRLDLEVTTELVNPDPRFADREYQRLVRLRNQSRGRPSDVGRQEIHGKGYTLYHGSRKSDRFLRLYDKGLEEKSHAPGLWWRSEVEVKRRPALHTAQALYAAGENVRAAVQQMVFNELERRRVTPLFTAAGN